MIKWRRLWTYFSSFAFRASFVIRHSCFVILERFPRLRARLPLQVVFRFRGLGDAHRPPWHRALRHRDPEHDERAEAAELPHRAQAKRRWKSNHAPIQHDFHTLHRCIASRESEYRAREGTRRERFVRL